MEKTEMTKKLTEQTEPVVTIQMLVDQETKAMVAREAVKEMMTLARLEMEKAMAMRKIINQTEG